MSPTPAEPWKGPLEQLAQRVDSMDGDVGVLRDSFDEWQARIEQRLAALAAHVEALGGGGEQQDRKRLAVVEKLAGSIEKRTAGLAVNRPEALPPAG